MPVEPHFPEPKNNEYTAPPTPPILWKTSPFSSMSSYCDDDKNVLYCVVPSANILKNWQPSQIARASFTLSLLFHIWNSSTIVGRYQPSLKASPTLASYSLLGSYLFKSFKGLALDDSIFLIDEIQYGANNRARVQARAVRRSMSGVCLPCPSFYELAIIRAISNTARFSESLSFLTFFKSCESISASSEFDSSDNLLSIKQS